MRERKGLLIEMDGHAAARVVDADAEPGTMQIHIWVEKPDTWWIRLRQWLADSGIAPGARPVCYDSVRLNLTPKKAKALAMGLLTKSPSDGARPS